MELVPSTIVLCGPSGSGKSSVGFALAEALSWHFIEADCYHSEESKAKMRRGEGLTDEDRWPWLQKLKEEADAHTPCVLACSALKKSYRDFLAGGSGRTHIVFVLLLPSPVELEGRLHARATQGHGHFAGPTLLASQLATLDYNPTAAAAAAALDKGGDICMVFQQPPGKPSPTQDGIVACIIERLGLKSEDRSWWRSVTDLPRARTAEQ